MVESRYVVLNPEVVTKLRWPVILFAKKVIESVTLDRELLL